MLELTLNTATPGGKADIQVPVSKLLVKHVITHAAAQFPPTVSAALAAILGYIPDAFVEAIRQSQAGAKPILQRMSIRDLAELAANNEGYVNCYQNAAFTQTTIEYTIELSNFGALNSEGSRFVQIIADGFVAAATTTFIYSIGAPIVTDTILRYKAVACQANSQKAFNVGDAYAIAVPDTTTILELAYPNGNVFVIRQAELENIAADLNEIVYNVEGRGYPYRKWRIVPCELADIARVTLSADGPVYLLINEHE